MTGFASDWLDLREPADGAARDPRLLALAAGTVAADPGTPIVDLGCGTGSTARALGPHLPPGAVWRLVDHDPALIAIAAARLGGDAQAVVADLSDLTSLPLGGAGLVTGSALFDLVSAAWIDGFAERLAATGAPLYAALTYDGRTEWTPGHPADADVLAAFNRHQRSDKGLGPAMGPDAPTALAQALRARGYGVEAAQSDWRLGPDQAALTVELAHGIAQAVIEAGMAAERADDWLAFRIENAASGHVLVGHVDLFARPETKGEEHPPFK